MNAHNSAKMPEDVSTVRPNVDSAMNEPSKMKWISASNVCINVFSLWERWQRWVYHRAASIRCQHETWDGLFWDEGHSAMLYVRAR
jgi:hypothetical protein